MEQAEYVEWNFGPFASELNSWEFGSLIGCVVRKEALDRKIHWLVVHADKSESIK